LEDNIGCTRCYNAGINFIIFQLFGRSTENSNVDYELIVLDTIHSTSNIPLILRSEEGKLEGYGFGDEKNEDQIFLKQKEAEFEASDKKPLELNAGYANEALYFDTTLYKAAKYFPLFQIALISLFIALGYYLFSSARKAEQNRVWAGMAKETAHQLGTPISAIIAWIEMLKLGNEDKPDQLEIISELRNDVTRLELVEEMQICEAYMKKRAPRKMNFTVVQKGGEEQSIMINKHLFAWVVENIYRNALDAMSGTGQITTTTYIENEYVCIDIKDSGKGMPASIHKTVFEPGYSTKTRGWGLGLSLAKRIIENYHSGKIFVKSSKPNEGTTFTIKLPKA